MSYILEENSIAEDPVKKSNLLDEYTLLDIHLFSKLDEWTKNPSGSVIFAFTLNLVTECEA